MVFFFVILKEKEIPRCLLHQIEVVPSWVNHELLYFCIITWIVVIFASFWLCVIMVVAISTLVSFHL